LSENTPNPSAFNARRDHFQKAIDGEVDLSPATAMLGWNVQEYDADAGSITVNFEAKPEFCNAGGIVHGGMLAAMLDDTLAPALGVMVDDNQYTPTIELKLNYLRPAAVGPIIGKAQVVRRGRTIGFVEGHLEDEAGRVLVTATGTFIIETMKE
jgi:uncharacterized protein (TIGR00369 family)